MTKPAIRERAIGSTTHRINCRGEIKHRVWMIGLISTIIKEPIKEKFAVVEHLCKPFLDGKEIWKEKVDNLNLN